MRPASLHRITARAASTSYTPLQVAQAYNYPTGVTGKGYTCGIIELGGGFGQADLKAYFGQLGLPVPSVTAVLVDGGKNKSDGPSGADGEVLLDIEVAAAVAPGADFRVYFCPNTDSGFYGGIAKAYADGCDVVSISWGGPETSWSKATMDSFDALFATGKAQGVLTFVASGDSGSKDGTRTNVVDFPASSPNVVACGGTRLTLDSSGQRASEVTWDDSDTTSATGGGVSAHSPGRQVPDVAGNADPQTGYEVLVDGQEYVIGGTSAVAPLYAGLALLLSEAVGQRVGKVADFVGTIAANPSVAYDVTIGDNGGYRAGPGRDETTGFGVVDGTRFLAALGATPVPTPDPVPDPTPDPTPAPPSISDLINQMIAWLEDLIAKLKAMLS